VKRDNLTRHAPFQLPKELDFVAKREIISFFGAKTIGILALFDIFSASGLIRTSFGKQEREDVYPCGDV
jgi:hypothetical protein